MNLSRYEQEVLINFNADGDMATLYSANPVWIRKMEKLRQEFPDIFILKKQTEISKTYVFPKKFLRIGKPKVISYAQRENLERMRQEKERRK